MPILIGQEIELGASSIGGKRLPYLTYSGDHGVDMILRIEMTEADSHSTFGKGSNGFVRSRGAMQACANRDPKCFIENGPSESDIGGIEPKRNDTRAWHRLAKDRNAIDVPQSVHQRSRKFGLVFRNRITADSGHMAA
jgi:hypothetical protein